MKSAIGQVFSATHFRDGFYLGDYIVGSLGMSLSSTSIASKSSKFSKDDKQHPSQ